MKQKQLKRFLLIITILMVNTLFITNQHAYATSKKGDAAQNTTQNTDNSNNMQVLYAGKNYICHSNPIQTNSIWMIPAKEIIKNYLGGSYNYSQTDQTITIKSAGRENSIKFTINSKQTIYNGVSETTSQQVFSTPDQDDYYIPLDYTLKKLGYTYTLSNNIITITDSYVYTISADSTEYSSEKYNNALESVAITKNASNSINYIQGITIQPMNKSDISFQSDAKNYSISISYNKTKNAIGNISQKINNNIIEELSIEEKNNNTIITIKYNKKYIYTTKIASNRGKITLSKGSFSLKIALPDNVSYSKITTTDEYWKNRFIITIPNNNVTFYKKYAPFKNSSSIKGISISKTSSGNTNIIVTTTSLKGYKLTKSEGCFTVKIGSPKSIYKNIVLLDPGHGGKDSGAVKNGMKEKNLNLSILYTYAKKYFDDKDSPVKAYWTRHDDTFINLYKRPALSKVYSADLFVSLHINEASSSSANGTEVFYSTKNNKTSFSGITSKIFATRMKNSLVNNLNNKNRGVKQANFVVNKYNTVPAILIELGFISGSSDKNKLKNTTYKKKAAKVIYDNIVSTFKAYPTKR